MRHGSPPRLLALQLILSPNRRESLPTPSAGVRIIRTYPFQREADRQRFAEGLYLAGVTEHDGAPANPSGMERKQNTD